MIKKINQGLTLIELIAYISILVLVGCFTIPVFESSNRKHVISTEQRIFSALQFARLQAIINQKPTTVHSTNWSTGLTISFENEINPLRVESFQSTTVTLSAFNNIYTLTYCPDGRSLTNGHFDISSTSNDNYKSKVIFHQSGRIRRE
ncbi:MAG: GspH/FimT family pseudopilin [Gammaproteobacteria bacterium]